MMKLMFFSMSLIFMLTNKKLKFFTVNYMMIMLIIGLMNYNYNNYFFYKIYYNLGYDSISINLMLLTFWILSLSMLANNTILNKLNNKLFISLIIILSLMLMLCLTSLNLFMFYIFFESSLIPMIFIIMGWGMQIDRIQASMYMLFYTLIGSLPLMVIFIFTQMKFYTMSITLLLLDSQLINNYYIYMFMMIAFLIKMPMYLVHMWLPKAHVEAPISGSMILAGIMLKLGSYGIYRMMPIFHKMNMNYNYIIICISLTGSIYSSLICLNQTDLKIIVAYSSVVHMNLMLASLMTLNCWSILGSMWMMIAHGLCSSAMFCLVNFNYERIHSRNLLINKGLMNIFPTLSLMWFMMCSSNFSAPPSLNLFSEMILINGLMIWNKMNMPYIFFIILFSTCYSIYLFSITQQGKMMTYMNLSNVNIREYMIIMLHWVPLNIMFLTLMMN
uniref:NADH-ubiquinone oxidoreductase chain 4 n=1 Tax=Dinocampus coccinellae TaxID=144245 RepID=A0A343YVD0_9HYME|nr:NADH dehydrogenase subunit 4 [Dinocampus coccinellae]